MQSAVGLAYLQLSFYIKRWCNASVAAFIGSGYDDNQFSANNFKYAFFFWKACHKERHPI